MNHETRLEATDLALQALSEDRPFGQQARLQGFMVLGFRALGFEGLSVLERRV